MANTNELIAKFTGWFDELPRKKASDQSFDFPARGTVGGALVVIEKLKERFDLDIRNHLTPQGGQVAGVSGGAVSKILRRHGEQRILMSEGRTNRGLIRAMESMLKLIDSFQLQDCSAETRNVVLEAFQGFLAGKVTEFLNQAGLPFEYKPTQSTVKSVQDLLVIARKRGVEGQVAQHLVGAKLQLRYPEMIIENHSCSTADIQLGRSGDFQIADTVIHVTVALSKQLVEKCIANVKSGLRVYVLVPERSAHGDRAFVEQHEATRIAVFSIEGFVAQNIDELSAFSREQQRKQLSELLHTYNLRVKAVETDKSFLIDIPSSLLFAEVEQTSDE